MTDDEASAISYMEQITVLCTEIHAGLARIESKLDEIISRPIPLGLAELAAGNSTSPPR